MVDAGLADTRSDAFFQLSSLQQVGLLHHVTYEHGFEDKNLFYAVTGASEIKIAIDRLVASKNSGRRDEDEDDDWTTDERIQHAALMERYKQATGSRRF